MSYDGTELLIDGGEIPISLIILASIGPQVQHAHRPHLLTPCTASTVHACLLQTHEKVTYIAR